MKTFLTFFLISFLFIASCEKEQNITSSSDADYDEYIPDSDNQDPDNDPDSDTVSGECIEGETYIEPCGLNNTGKQTMVCNYNGIWEKSGDCADYDQCVNGETKKETCGFNDRGTLLLECKNGFWEAGAQCDDDDECFDNEIKTTGCGESGSGIISRTCINGSWGEESDCFCGNSGYEIYEKECFRILGPTQEDYLSGNFDLMRGLGGRTAEGEEFTVPFDGKITVVKVFLWRFADYDSDVVMSLYKQSSEDEFVLEEEKYTPLSTLPDYYGLGSSLEPTFFYFDDPVEIKAGDIVQVLFNHDEDALVSAISTVDIVKEGYALAPSETSDWDFFTTLFIDGN